MLHTRFALAAMAAGVLLITTFSICYAAQAQEARSLVPGYLTCADIRNEILIDNRVLGNYFESTSHLDAILERIRGHWLGIGEWIYKDDIAFHKEIRKNLTIQRDSAVIDVNYLADVLKAQCNQVISDNPHVDVSDRPIKRLDENGQSASSETVNVARGLMQSSGTSLPAMQAPGFLSEK